MISQNSRENLNDLLFDNFITNSECIKNMQNIEFDLKARIRPEKIAKIFNNHLDISVIDNSEVYFLTKYFYDKLQDKLINNFTNEDKRLMEQIDPAKFFNLNEVGQYIALQDIDYSVIENDNDILIQDVVEIIPNREYRSAKVSIQDLKSFMDRNLITYNPNAQRPSEKRIVKGQVKEKISINKKSVKEIKQLIIDKEYFPPSIAFNILTNGKEKFKYEDGVLDINVIDGCEVDVIDGMHNYLGFIEALREDSNIKLYYMVYIYRVDEVTARNFIGMRNKQNLFKLGTKNYYDTSNVYNLIANDINTEGTNASNLMRNKLGKDIEDVSLLGKYCTFKTLSKAIQDNFDINKNDTMKAQNVKLYLIKYFNTVISLYKTDFDDVNKSRETSYITFNNMIYGLVALASKLYIREDWQMQLCNILNNMIFDKTAKEWKNKGLTMKEITGKQLVSLYNYFYELAPKEVKEVASDGE